ncbi:hypothetical protein MF271_01435 (plasmid) [Deinococcus sp. KNUC1210]|uniref:hypothetical protein n=1 Tax=Deinococcus sp. KNUC1210 TaxID=2917691 RepID=UPI001EEFE76F|nr:hypothetical protein [Deinococcus sp. KNUC1210]ULH14215.1 hypothetical protein MF271_01435 [Deinococcus sp. KNUC1210]
MQMNRQVLATGTGIALVTGAINKTQPNDAGLLSTPAVWLHVVGKAALLYGLEFHWRREGRERHFLLDVYREVTTRELQVLSKTTFEALENEFSLEGMPVHGPNERRLIDVGVVVMTPNASETLRMKFTRSTESTELLVMPLSTRR